MTTIIKRLQKFQSTTPSRLKQNIKARLANQDERRNARKIATKMLNAMEAHKMTESALAIRLEISNEELSSYIKGHKCPSSSLLEKISSELEISLNDLIYTAL